MAIDASKKPRPDFVVRLDGEGIRPWEVPARSLARVLEAVQRLIDQRDEDAEQENSDDLALEKPASEIDLTATPNTVLRLIGITDGSAAYRVRAPNASAAIRLLQDTGGAIAKPDAADWSAATLSSVKQLSDVARSLDCVIEFRLPPSKGQTYGDVLATIRPKTYDEISGSAFVKGHTSVFAKIERVGGAVERHCGVHVLGQTRLVICRVDGEDLIRDLGKYIYKEVLLTGTATWVRKNLRLKSLHITGFEAPKAGSVMKALSAAYEAGGRVWDTIEDPDAFIAEMRRA